MPLYYVCALPNKKGAGAPREFFSNDPAKIERWARQHDKPGWGVYDCPNPLKDGATARNKESIAAVVSVRVDIDKLADDDDVPLRVMACPTNLIKDHPRLIADIREQLAPDEKPAAVVLDTLNRSLIGSESKDADMAAYIFAATAIREAFKCLVIVIHHCGWDETRPRGHSALPGAVDGQLAIVRDGDAVTLLVEFLRDGAEGAEIHSAVKVIEVGQDVTGKMLTSLVVVAANRPAQSSIRTWPKSLLVLRRALKTMLASHGEDFQENILTLPVRAVALEH